MFKKNGKYVYSYDELLEYGSRISKLTIRDYCQNVCKGKCCQHDYDYGYGESCNSNIKCSRKLPCVLYMCPDSGMALRNRLEKYDLYNKFFGYNDYDRFDLWTVMKSVFNQIREALDIEDAYFYPYSYDDVKDIKFSLYKKIPKFSKKELNKFKAIINNNLNVKKNSTV